MKVEIKRKKEEKGRKERGKENKGERGRKRKKEKTKGKADGLNGPFVLALGLMTRTVEEDKTWSLTVLRHHPLTYLSRGDVLVLNTSGMT